MKCLFLSELKPLSPLISQDWAQNYSMLTYEGDIQKSTVPFCFNLQMKWVTFRAIVYLKHRKYLSHPNINANLHVLLWLMKKSEVATALKAVIITASALGFGSAM